MTIRSRLLLLTFPPLIAFLILASFFYYFNLSREILLIGSCATLLLVIGIVFLMADRISKPVRQLNQAALEIAAGDYAANIEVDGPKEIVELAHTLNTMSECLVENMSRLRESSLIRERMHGELECALLLQHYMLQKVIEDFHHPHITVRSISIPLSPLQKGLFLMIDPGADDLTVTLIEAQEIGFPGLFKLNQFGHTPKGEFKEMPYVRCQFVEDYNFMRYKTHELHPPLVWSVKGQQFIKGSRHEIPLQNRDMIFLYNSSLIEHFETADDIQNWFSRVLRHFAEDGLDSIQLMLTNELTFLAKKHHAKHNIKIICFQKRTEE